MGRKVLLPLAGGGEQVRCGELVAEGLGAELCLFQVRRSPAPAETIARYAEFIRADAILMSSGRQTLDVLRCTRQPLWVTKRESVGRRRILCAVGLGSQAEPVLRYAGGLAERWGAEILAVHAVPEISEAMLAGCGLYGGGPVELRPEVAGERVAAAAAGLGVRCEVEVRVGGVDAVVRRVARRWQADLVVVGRGRRMEPWRLSSHIGPILTEAPCTVVVEA